MGAARRPTTVSSATAAQPSRPAITAQTTTASTPACTTAPQRQPTAAASWTGWCAAVGPARRPDISTTTTNNNINTIALWTDTVAIAQVLQSFFLPSCQTSIGRLKPSCKLYVFEIKQPIHRSDHFFQLSQVTLTTTTSRTVPHHAAHKQTSAAPRATSAAPRVTSAAPRATSGALRATCAAPRLTCSSR